MRTTAAGAVEQQQCHGLSEGSSPNGRGLRVTSKSHPHEAIGRLHSTDSWAPTLKAGSAIACWYATSSSASAGMSVSGTYLPPN